MLFYARFAEEGRRLALNGECENAILLGFLLQKALKETEAYARKRDAAILKLEETTPEEAALRKKEREALLKGVEKYQGLTDYSQIELLDSSNAAVGLALRPKEKASASLTSFGVYTLAKKLENDAFEPLIFDMPSLEKEPPSPEDNSPPLEGGKKSTTTTTTAAKKQKVASPSPPKKKPAPPLKK